MALLGALSALVVGACGDDGRVAPDPLDGGDGATDAAALDATSDGAQQHDASLADGAASDATQVAPCESTPGADRDQDGVANGVDCNDCDPHVNPGAYDVPGNGVDEDCSGVADDEPTGCDGDLPMAADDAFQAARALGLCRRQSGDSWGLISAKWVFPDGSAQSLDADLCPVRTQPHPLSRSILPVYGARNRPTEGARMTMLSSGVARSGSVALGPESAPATGTSPSDANLCAPSRPPAGFPRVSSLCPPASTGSSKVYDGVALELSVRVPSNATAFAFDFNFFTSEFPAFVCDGKNDQFVALLSSRHPSIPADKNVSFDKQGNAITVDTAFLDVCRPVTYGGRSFACARGPADLQGTALDIELAGDNGQTYLRGGATGWLSTTAPVVAGETITLRLAIWDSDDPINDSSVLLDNARWTIATAVAPPPDRPPVTDVILY